MEFEQLIFEKQGRVAVVTLNRPEKLNTWTQTMASELSDAMYACDEDDDVRAVIITGAGRAFCAGADISGGSGGFTSGGPARKKREPKWPYQIRKPVIAAINGAAIGVGMTYPMLADIRIAADNAKIGFAMVRRGILPELASHITVPLVAGFSNAADLLLTGRIITADRAERMGVISECVPKDDLMTRAMEIAEDIAANTAPVSVALSKQLLWETNEARMSDLMAVEGKMLAWLGGTADVKEGVQSFLEKRPPEWTMSPSKDIPEDWG